MSRFKMRKNKTGLIHLKFGAEFWTCRVQIIFFKAQRFHPPDESITCSLLEISTRTHINNHASLFFVLFAECNRLQTYSKSWWNPRLHRFLFVDCIVVVSSMATSSPLTKQLWNELSRIKIFTSQNNLENGKFFYENSLFCEPQEDSSTQSFISGRLWPTSNIYKDHALRIEIHLPSTYPLDPPAVKIDTVIYHPNVDNKGEWSYSYQIWMSFLSTWNLMRMSILTNSILGSTVICYKLDEVYLNAIARSLIFLSLWRRSTLCWWLDKEWCMETYNDFDATSWNYYRCYW